jgi:hypothetical protein
MENSNPILRDSAMETKTQTQSPTPGQNVLECQALVPFYFSKKALLTHFLETPKKPLKHTNITNKVKNITTIPY